MRSFEAGEIELTESAVLLRGASVRCMNASHLRSDVSSAGSDMTSAPALVNSARAEALSPGQHQVAGCLLAKEVCRRKAQLAVEQIVLMLPSCQIPLQVAALGLRVGDQSNAAGGLPKLALPPQALMRVALVLQPDEFEALQMHASSRAFVLFRARQERQWHGLGLSNGAEVLLAQHAEVLGLTA